MSNSAASFFTSLTTPSKLLVQCNSSPLPSSTNLGKWSLRIRASSSFSAAAPGVDLSTLQAAISKYLTLVLYFRFAFLIGLLVLLSFLSRGSVKNIISAFLEKDSNAVKEALDQLVEVGWARKWSSQPYVSRRTTSLRELTTLGIKNAENLAIPSVRNDAAFLFTVVGTTGFLGVLAGQLPGDWGFFVPYLIGSISLVVLGVGSTSPGLLQAAIDGFSSFFPDYQERIARHEAAHFLVAYLIGLPILGYSLDIGKEHVNLIDERLEKLIYSGQLDSKELDRLAVVAMAGLAAEGLKYDKVIGQSADLFTLQRFLNRSKPSLSKDQQQNLTRWAVLFAGSLLKNNSTLHEALITAMTNKASVTECIEAIEKAA